PPPSSSAFHSPPFPTPGGRGPSFVAGNAKTGASQLAQLWDARDPLPFRPRAGERIGAGKAAGERRIHRNRGLAPETASGLLVVVRVPRMKRFFSTFQEDWLCCVSL